MMSKTGKLPLPFRVANAILRKLIGAGVPIGNISLLSVPGRKSGLTRTTPVALYALHGQRYLVAEADTLDWVRNVRAAGGATITQRGHSEQVRLVELSPDEAAPILQTVVREERGASAILGISRDSAPEAFIQAAASHPIFRVVEVAEQAVPSQINEG
jgi:deazaflavin-dependent oxidoreductase (nitroreductase family)